jgi:hypothetical protein
VRRAGLHILIDRHLARRNRDGERSHWNHPAYNHQDGAAREQSGGATLNGFVGDVILSVADPERLHVLGT